MYQIMSLKTTELKQTGMASDTDISSFRASLNLRSECLHGAKWGHTVRAYRGCPIKRLRVLFPLICDIWVHGCAKTRTVEFSFFLICMFDFFYSNWCETIGYVYKKINNNE